MAKTNNTADPLDSESKTLTPAQTRAESFRIAAGRETIEAFVVAFILALLFRAFLAEAFVIPTGSMAPTLMGAHKDIFCDRCGYNFRVGASRERADGNSVVVVGGICANCRHVNSMDLASNSDHATFNGDRILVNKFSYVLGDPERWDVIVFKFPGNPKQNYIKRLVGLPNETLTILHGDVYARETGTDDRPEILRKPPSTLLAMSHLVYDTDYQSEMLINADYPSRWQSWTENATEPPTDSWKVNQSVDGVLATVTASDEPKWLRYFHHFPDDEQWADAAAGVSLADANPYQTRAITDFYTYDSYIQAPFSYVFANAGSGGAQGSGYFSGLSFNPRYQSGEGPEQFGGATTWGGMDSGDQQLGRDGMHWVGDLIAGLDIETTSDANELVLELVEAGVRHQCRFDLTSGSASLSIIDFEGNPQRFDTAEESDKANASPTAMTSVQAGSRHHIRFSNCDDQILLWVDEKVVTFDAPTTFQAGSFRKISDDRPRITLAHPLDASPVGIAVRGGSSTIRHLQVLRDKYYISTESSRFGGIFDYDRNQLSQLTGRGMSQRQIQDVLADPTQWDSFAGWQTRREVSFELQADQFFPMGDNSPESLDARCWAGTKAQTPMPRDVNRDAWKWGDVSYVPRDLLVGRAVVVFWPHSWNSPVPFTPNFKRMKLIR
ncbi:signal peptidase I [Rubripirellula amarantea]|nr:signal peptidase I [Rubripirellula amarantea]